MRSRLPKTTYVPGVQLRAGLGVCVCVYVSVRARVLCACGGGTDAPPPPPPRLPLTHRANGARRCWSTCGEWKQHAQQAAPARARDRATSCNTPNNRSLPMTQQGRRKPPWCCSARKIQKGQRLSVLCLFGVEQKEGNACFGICRSTNSGVRFLIILRECAEFTYCLVVSPVNSTDDRKL